MITAEPKHLAAERLEKLRMILGQRRIARVDELSAALGVSPATVRRDLEQLESAGHIRRVHGGAVHVDGKLEEPHFDDKAATAAEEKQRIARAALDLVKPSESIFLDGGSTTLLLARLLQSRPDVTVVTNSLRVAAELAGGGPRLLLVGGELRRRSQTFVGTLTQCLIDQLHVDSAFMGTIGVSAESGMTTTDPHEAYTKTEVMSHAQNVVLLADSRKFGTVSFVRFGSFDRLNLIITDKGAPADQLRQLRKRGVRVVTV